MGGKGIARAEACTGTYGQEIKAVWKNCTFLIGSGGFDMDKLLPGLTETQWDLSVLQSPMAAYADC